MTYSVNSYSSASKRTGLSGLMSGLDTDELVKQMTSGTRSKIATQLQKKQQTTWKQTAYRDVISKINAFQNKYLTYSAGKNNILSQSFFKTSSITNASPYVKVSGDANVAKNVVIKDIAALAETERFTSAKTFSSQMITSGTIDATWSETSVAGSAIMVKFGGETHNISVAKDFSFSSGTLTEEQKINEIIESLNKSIKGNEKLAIKDVDGNVTGGKITITLDSGLLKINNTSGDGTDLELMGGEVELMAGLGLKTSLPAGAAITGGAMDTTKLFSEKVLKDVLAGTTLNMSFNGIEKSISFNESDKELYKDADSLATYLQTAIDKAYGANKITASNVGGKLTFATTEANAIFSVKSSDKAGVMGLKGALKLPMGISTRASWNTSLKDMASQLATPITAVDGKYKLTINGTSLEFKETDTMSDVLNKVNNSEAGVRMTYSTTSDTFSLSSKESGVQGRVEITNSGATNDLATSLFGDAAQQTLTQGADATLNVSFDGGKTFSTVVRSGNSFALDGLNIELLGKADGATEENIKFGGENNVDELVTKMTDFFKDYNELVKICSDQVSQAKNKDYVPLTDEQKEDMSEKEIENWEAKAKEGVLSNDSNLNRLLINLRSAMNSAVDGTSSALYKIGIKSTKWEENGQLHIDETALRKALTENPEEITSLFTNVNEADPSKSGLATRLSTLMNATAGTFGGNGVLVQIAGKTGDSARAQDRLSLQIRAADRQLLALKTTLQTQENRYYKQFTQLEQYLSKMSSQSSWFESQKSS